MNTDYSLALLILVVLLILYSLFPRPPELTRPPQIVLVQAETPQRDSGGWLLLALIIFLLLKALGMI